MRRLLFQLLTVMALLATPLVASAQEVPPREGHFSATDLAFRGEGGWPQYRIPALTTSTRGTLIAAYDGRPSMADLPSHIALLVRRSTDNGRTWSTQQVVRSDPAPNGYGDPSLLVDRRTGRIFLFYASSVNQGYLGSRTGNSDTDPNILQADYSWSDDDGVSWQHRRITSMIKNPAWGGMFASSGEGIQLRHGRYAGRLIQQYTIRHGNGNYAVSAYSDDHGDTWRMGELVGPGADENKTVELSDGTVMLNVRANPNRRVATSTDGGVTYSALQPDPELVDQGNNGSITRVFPDAAAGDPRSRMLLFSNTPDTGIRRNLTVKLSCDDGASWPVRRVVEPGGAGYSTMTRLPDGSIGMLYERFGYQYLTFARFDLTWLGGLCAPVVVTPPQTHPAGTTGGLAVRISNQEQRPITAGRLTLDLPDGWQSTPVPVDPIPPGESVAVTVPFSSPATAAGDAAVTASFEAAGRRSAGTATVAVTADPAAPARSGLSALPVLDNIAVGGRPGLLDDVLAYWTRVTNTGNTILTGITVTGNQDNLERCRFSSLAPGASYVCRFGRHTVTLDDLRAGEYVPELTVTGTAPDGATATTRATSTPVAVAPPAASTQPAVVPSLRQWNGVPGEPWAIGDDTRIVREGAAAATAQTFAADLAAMTGRRLPIVTAAARPGDIVLADSTDGSLGDEGYRLSVDRMVRIEAPAETGAFYGTQTVLQLLRADPHRRSLPKGVARDVPRLGTRSQMLDVGRKYYPMSYLKQQIRRMAWHKLNVFHLHFTDWRGFRIETESFPGLTAKDGAYSKADLRELQDYAAKYHVRIVPEVDLPGHATPITAYDPSLRFACPSMDYAIWPGGELGGWTLDITKPHTRQFVKRLLDEIVPLFDGPTFHVGGDEIGYDDRKNACPELVQYAQDRGFAYPGDVFVDFMNELNDVVRSHGKTTEMWEWWNVYGQKSSISPDKDIVIDSWVSSDPSALAAQGYRVVATPENLLYVSAGFGQRPGQYGYVDVRKVYQDYAFPAPDGVLGYKVARWSDKAEDQSPEWFDFYARRPLQVLADRTWGGPRAPSVWEFFARADAVGDPPGSPGGELTAVPTGAVEVTTDSQETAQENGVAANVLDSNPYSTWHTAYTPAEAPMPHHLTLDLGASYPIGALRYQPRQDGGSNGRVAAYSVSVSTDGANWRRAAAGTFADDATEKTVSFPVTVARHVRFDVTGATNGRPFAGAAELSLWRAPS